MIKISHKKITELLPHRAPFLFVDKILSMKGNKIVASKTISGREGYLKGHFPDNPIVPGVLIIESMAQTAGIIVAHRFSDGTNKTNRPNVLYLSRVNDIKFKAPVFPKETIVVSAELLGHFAGSAKVSVKAEVNGKIVAGGELVLSKKEKNGGAR